MRFRPCIDLKNGKVVQIVGGTLSDSDDEHLDTNFTSANPSEFYADLYRRDQLVGGHVIALGGGNEDAALSALSTYPGGLQYGGGVNLDNSVKYLDAGASHVIITSFVFRDGKFEEERLKAIVEKIGRDRLVLDLSCRKRDGKYWVVTDRWQKFSELVVDEKTLDSLSSYCSEFLVHGVDVEGKMAGIENELVQMLGEQSPIPVTYAGGARSLADLEKVKDLGKGRVDLTIGSALDIFGGSTAYADVVDWDRKQTGVA